MRHQRQIALAVDRHADRPVRQRHSLDEARRPRRDVDHLNEAVDDQLALVGSVDFVGCAEQRQLLVRVERHGEGRGDVVLGHNLAQELCRESPGIDHRQRVAERRIIDLVGAVGHRRLRVIGGDDERAGATVSAAPNARRATIRFVMVSSACRHLASRAIAESIRHRDEMRPLPPVARQG